MGVTSLKKLCNFVLHVDGTEWNLCKRLGEVRPKTCEKCVFNKCNRKLMNKAKAFYRVVR